jgi:hypothetical protein
MADELPTVADGRFYCESCSFRVDHEGDCPRCKDDVLLDLEDEDVRLMLQEMDAAAVRKRTILLGGAAAMVAVPLAGGLAIFSGSGTGIVVAWFAIAIGLGFVLNKLFGVKARHPV